MNLHEYQAKQLFAEYGLPVSKGIAVDTPTAAGLATAEIDGDKWVIKVQVHAGGRGKAGGVKLVDSAAAAEEFADQWLGKNLVTYQTDARGQPVHKVLVEACVQAVGRPIERVDANRVRRPSRARVQRERVPGRLASRLLG